MAMNGTTMGQAMKTAVDSYIAGLSDSEKKNMGDATRQRIFEIIGEQIVAHVTANAQISSSGTTTGVQTGAGTAPTTTTGTIT